MARFYYLYSTAWYVKWRPHKTLNQHDIIFSPSVIFLFTHAN